MAEKILQNDDAIIIKGARVHNLKNVHLEIPRDKLTVITGPSGSGKSSLAFDTIYAEGQRRYVESLSAYARQFLDQLSKPDVDLISGLSPTIAIEQRTISYNPRSTVGTVTEIYDYMRLLFARVARPVCYECKKPIASQSPSQMVDFILSYKSQTKISILAPVVRGRKGEYQKELLQFRQRGFVRVRVDGEVRDLSETITLDRQKKHDIEVFVDRLIIKEDPSGSLATRIADSIELASKLSDGVVLLEVVTGDKKEDVLLSEKFACPNCGISYPTPEPRMFSFNSPMGSCKTCDGIGIEKMPDPDDENDDNEENDAGDDNEIDVHKNNAKSGGKSGSNDKSKTVEDLDLSDELRSALDEKKPCPDCKGARLRIEALHFLIENRNIHQLCELDVDALSVFFEKIKLSSRELLIADRVLKEIRERIQFLTQVGVGYLSLGRPSSTLSGGEAQRIRLATQIGSSLVGVIYVLDEPSIGLHQRDNHKLISTLERLRDLGNTVLVVEHDQDTMEKADFIVDFGPAAGRLGGEVVAVGDLNAIKKATRGLTGPYLSGRMKINVPKRRRPIDKTRVIELRGAHRNNLRNVDVELPLGLFTCVTGVSGSGKSTLIVDTLFRILFKHVYNVQLGDPAVKSVKGLEHVDKVVDVDQSPIGRTPRSNPATYIGLFGQIRDLFARLPESQVRGYGPGRFSFNVKGGRCEACEGDGVSRISMHFLPDVFVPCDVCKGRRYNKDTLDILYKGKNIADVLSMTAEEALVFFESISSIKYRIQLLNDVGLGYVQLGQSSTTLSGGESQRIKLTRELAKRPTGKTVYILDEPSTGLHFDDVKKLIEILQRLTDTGNTVIVIEHNLDIIKCADHVIDLGPEGGRGGGEIVGIGTPEHIIKIAKSYTGQYLKPVMTN